MSFNYVDYAFFAIFILFSIYSLRRGFMKRTAGFAACVASFILTMVAMRYLPAQIPFIAEHKAVAYAVLFVLLWVVLKFLLHRIFSKFTDNLILGTADKILGLAVGLLQAAIIIFVISYIIYFFNERFALQSVVIQQIIHFLHG
ncbi:MAG: CvpA family protein [Clostridia bacterium]|nr:CvpA family protein [Clostridia bacterium]